MRIRETIKNLENGPSVIRQTGSELAGLLKACLAMLIASLLVGLAVLAKVS